MLKLLDDYDSLLSTILIGNNVVNILFTSIMTVQIVNALGEESGAGVSTLVSTVIILIFAEISPKSVAKEHTERFAMWSAPLINGLRLILKPINFLFSQWKKLLSLIFRSSGDEGLTEEEFMTLIEEVEEAGTINSTESEFIRRAVEFTEIPAEAVMTPRTDVIALPLGASDEEVRETFNESGYSRLPIYDEDIDHIAGLIHIKRYMETDSSRLRDIIEPALFVPENTKINRLLRRMQQEKFHMAVVLDEYGGTAGVITLEDIMEELIGEIWDESDEVSEEIIRLSEYEYQFAGGVSIDKFFRLMDFEDETSSSTLSGWLIDGLGDFPEVGDVWENDHIYSKVTAIDRHRIANVYVKKKENNND